MRKDSMTEGDHTCKHEGEFAILEEMRKSINRIENALIGNGNPGIKTQVALNKAAIVRLWWAVGWIALSIGGSAMYIIKTGVLK